MDTQDIQFAPGILDVIKAPNPTAVDFFKGLPMPTDGTKWVVYAVILEKDGCTPALYVGSGTDSVQGAARRMRDYTTAANVSLNVARKINDGFRITAKGYLGWIQLPKASKLYRMCTLMVGLLEAAFKIIFCAMRFRKNGGMPKICPSDLENFSYDGLCNHFAVNEPIIINSYHLPLEMLHHCAPLTHIKLLVDFKADNIRTSVSPDCNLGLVDNDPEEDDFDGQEMICWTTDHTSKETSVHNRDRCLCLVGSAASGGLRPPGSLCSPGGRWTSGLSSSSGSSLPCGSGTSIVPEQSTMPKQSKYRAFSQREWQNH